MGRGGGLMGALIEEIPVAVPSRAGHLGAVVSVPADAKAAVGVVLTSGRARGRTHRNGMWIRLSDALASNGYFVLRLDYPGVGNSSGPPRVLGLDEPPIWAIEDACRFFAEQ